jgi:hypothetical protein
MLKHIISTTSLAILLPMSFAAAQTLSTRANVPQEPPTIPRQAVRPEVPTTRPPALTNHIPLNRPMPRLPERPVVPRTLNERGGVDTGGGDLVTQGNAAELLDMAEQEPELDRSRPEPFELVIGSVVRDNGYSYDQTELQFSLLRSLHLRSENVNSSNPSGENRHPITSKKLFSSALSRCLNGEYLANPTLHYGREASDANFQTSAIPKLKWAFMHEPLAEISDEGTIMMGDEDYRITQLAAQTGSQVLVHKASFFSMSQINQEMLYLHEGILCAVNHLNPSLIAQQGTAPIRRLARHIYASTIHANRNRIPVSWPAPVASTPQALMDSYEALGIPTYMPEREIRNEDGIKITMSGFKGMPAPIITFWTYSGRDRNEDKGIFNQLDESLLLRVCRVGNRSQRAINSCASNLNRWMTSNHARIEASWNAYLQE